MFWTRVQLPPGPPKVYWIWQAAMCCLHRKPRVSKSNYLVQYTFDGPVLVFDRASSSDMDDPVGDDRKSSKSIVANDDYFTQDLRLAA